MIGYLYTKIYFLELPNRAAKRQILFFSYQSSNENRESLKVALKTSHFGV